MKYADDYADWASDYDLFGEIETINTDERDMLDALLKECGAVSVLDCACGTGQHIVMLARLGYEMSGSDYSVAMLEACRANLDRLGIRAALKQCDYRELQSAWPQGFDAVLCMTQALNHMHTREDLVAALLSMRGRLHPGGLFVATQSTAHRTLGDEYRVNLVANNADFTRLLLRDIDGQFQTIRVVDVFHGGGRFDMKTHDIRIRLLLDDDYRELLAAAGFSDIRLYGGYDRSDYDRTASWKLIVTARA
jgi:2-polyprenyl-3-methyl-5-hydroxy-6-metoxy-1,4-benzoquinol methylase